MESIIRQPFRAGAANASSKRCAYCTEQQNLAFANFAAGAQKS
jgi:hypothetical protein